MLLEQNNFYDKFGTNPTLYNENKYKKHKNKLANIMRNSEKQFYSIELDNSKNNNRGTWKVLNKIWNKYKDNSKNSLKCIIDGNTVSNTPKDIANGYNKYFTEVCKVCHQIYKVVLEVYMIIWIETAIIECI